MKQGHEEAPMRNQMRCGHLKQDVEDPVRIKVEVSDEGLYIC